jgi:hypothetical protein
MRCLSVLLFLFVLAQGSAAHVAPEESRRSPSVPTERPKILRIYGEIKPETPDLFRTILDAIDTDIVVIDSGGGRIDEAIEIARIIRQRKLNTFIYGNNVCSSACLLLFMSGETKYAQPGAALGIHSASYKDGRRSEAGTRQMADYLRSVGVPEGIIKRMRKTAPMDMDWLSEDQLELLGIEVVLPPYMQK